ncbi:MAG: phosphoribosyl-ATP diphosphatase [Desulfuromonadia bacterium]
MDREGILLRLEEVIRSRRGGDGGSSYTASLFQRGLDTILKKVGEESTELVVAAKGGDRSQTVYEAADLLYHLLVLLAFSDIPLEEVYDELARRFGRSGIEEKRSRPR